MTRYNHPNLSPQGHSFMVPQWHFCTGLPPHSLPALPENCWIRGQIVISFPLSSLLGPLSARKLPLWSPSPALPLFVASPSVSDSSSCSLSLASPHPSNHLHLKVLNIAVFLSLVHPFFQPVLANSIVEACSSSQKLCSEQGKASASMNLALAKRMNAPEMGGKEYPEERAGLEQQGGYSGWGCLPGMIPGTPYGSSLSPMHSQL